MPAPDSPIPAEDPADPDPVPGAVERIDLGEPSRPEFEFTPAQERLMADMGGKMAVVGLIAIVAGVLLLLDLAAEVATGGTLRLSVLSLTPVVFILIGLWTRQAGGAYRQVAATHDRDITHLMDALEAQARVFRLAFWLFVAFAIFVVIGSIVGRLMATG